MKLRALFALISVLILNSTCVWAGESDGAFVILKASMLDEDRTIKNICLYRKSRCTYLEPSRSFTEIKPGSYRLWNVDFTDNEVTGRGNIGFDEEIQFRFRKNRVYLIGELQLSGRSGGRYKMEFKQDFSMLKQACLDLPKSALNFPLANATTGKEIDINCKKVIANREL